MGRYYSGDIEGKFWFAVQPSNAADRFGVKGIDASELEYYYDVSDLYNVIKELNSIEQTIGLENIKKLNDYWSSALIYNDEILKKNGIFDIWNKHKQNYVDYLLGIQIRDCIKKNGSCDFTAEK